MFLLMSYFGLGNVYWTFNFELVIRLFGTLKLFYLPKEAAKAEPKVVQLLLLMFFLGLETHGPALILKTIPTTSLRGPQRFTMRGRVAPEFDGTGWTGGRSSKVSFNFLHTLWAFRTCIYGIYLNLY